MEKLQKTYNEEGKLRSYRLDSKKQEHLYYYDRTNRLIIRDAVPEVYSTDVENIQKVLFYASKKDIESRINKIADDDANRVMIIETKTKYIGYLETAGIKDDEEFGIGERCYVQFHFKNPQLEKAYKNIVKDSLRNMCEEYGVFTHMAEVLDEQKMVTEIIV